MQSILCQCSILDMLSDICLQEVPFLSICDKLVSPLLCFPSIGAINWLMGLLASAKEKTVPQFVLERFSCNPNYTCGDFQSSKEG